MGVWLPLPRGYRYSAKRRGNIHIFKGLPGRGQVVGFFGCMASTDPMNASILTMVTNESLNNSLKIRYACLCRHVTLLPFFVHIFEQEQDLFSNFDPGCSLCIHANPEFQVWGSGV